MSKHTLSVAYFGSPGFSAKLLDNLVNNQAQMGIDINLVVTQPDRPAGRGLMIQKTAVKTMAEAYSLEVYDKPLQGQESKIIDIINQHKIDLAIVFAYNEIIPKQMLKKTRYGFWNIHPSILPKYRGSSPIVFPLILGDKQTGVSLIQMNDKMDDGNIIDVELVNISSIDNQLQLIASLTQIGYELIQRNIAHIDNIVSTSQDINQATYTRKLTRQDGYVAWPMIYALIEGKSIPVNQFVPYAWYQKRNKDQVANTTMTIANLYDLWRGLSPWPGIWTTIKIANRDTRIKILEMTNDARDHYHIKTIQVEGKKPTPFRLDLFQSAHESDSLASP